MPEMRLPKCVRTEHDDLVSRQSLLDDGWREVEILDVWVWNREERGQWTDCDVAKKGDRNQCVWIAGTAFTEDRLHKDPEVPDQLAARTKMKFTDQSFEDDEKAIYVVRVGEDVRGFVIVTADDDYCTINLIAVDRRHRRQGIARDLVNYLAAMYDQPIAAGTQATNEASIALYQSLGFEKQLSYRSFHK